MQRPDPRELFVFFAIYMVAVIADAVYPTHDTWAAKQAAGVLYWLHLAITVLRAIRFTIRKKGKK